MHVRTYQILHGCSPKRSPEAVMIGAVEQARAYLAGAGQRPVSTLPPSAMMSEIK
jgi:hypothetical protein